MKQVFVAKHPTEAHLIRGLLEANGIAAMVRGESLFGARGEAPVTPDTLPSVWILDDGDAARARGVLATQESPEDTGAWACPSCGEHLEPQFTQCWHCGTDQPLDDHG